MTTPGYRISGFAIILVTTALAVTTVGAVRQWDDLGRYAPVHRVGRILMNLPSNGTLAPGRNEAERFGIRWPEPEGTEFLGFGGMFLRYRGFANSPFISIPPRSFKAVKAVIEPRSLHEGCRGGRRYPHVGCDDDGDGLVDEDQADGIDNDGDGLVDEDFAAIGEEMHVVRAVEPTVGLILLQSSYAWSYGHVRDFIGITTTIRYPAVADDAPRPLVDFGALLVLDFDIGDPEDDKRGGDDRYIYVRTLKDPPASTGPIGFISAGGGKENGAFVAVVLLAAEGPDGSQLRAGGFIGDTAGGPDSLWNAVVPFEEIERQRRGIVVLPGEATGVHTGDEPPVQSATDERSPRGEREGDLAAIYGLETIPVFKPGDRLRIHWALVFGRSGEVLLRNVHRAIETYRGIEDEEGRPYHWVVPARKAARRELEVQLATVWVQGRRQPAVAIPLPQDLEAEEVEWLKVGRARTVMYELVGSKILVTIDPELVGAGEPLTIGGQLTDGTIFTATLDRELLCKFDTGSDQQPGCLPEKSIQLYPNPFLTSLNISINVIEPTTYSSMEADGGTPGTASVRIYDVQGRLVRTVLEEEFLHPGQYSLAWDGLDGDGAEVAAGVYYCKLQIGSRSMTKRVILLR
ncbi:MAG: T9SS type A sorting domain-containing protein [bacterium]|nr:MAG: T9SS type A sorting domain-containing protein [bacterium]